MASRILWNPESCSAGRRPAEEGADWEVQIPDHPVDSNACRRGDAGRSTVPRYWRRKCRLYDQGTEGRRFELDSPESDKARARRMKFVVYPRGKPPCRFNFSRRPRNLPSKMGVSIRFAPSDFERPSANYRKRSALKITWCKNRS